MESLIILLGTLAILACIPAAIAETRGRSFIAWWWLGFFFWLPALVVSVCLSKRSSRLCKACKAHLLSDDATKCSKCGSDQ